MIKWVKLSLLLQNNEFILRYFLEYWNYLRGNLESALMGMPTVTRALSLSSLDYWTES